MTESGYSLQQLAEIVDADIRGSDECRITGIAALNDAGPEHLSFLHNTRYRNQLKSCRAAAILVRDTDADAVESTALVVKDPYIAYARLSRLFAAENLQSQDISKNANIDPDAEIAVDVTISDFAVIGAGAVLHKGVSIGPNTVIGPGCSIGQNTRIAANVTLYSDVHIGEQCLIHSGAVLGADGFGFANDQGEWIKIHQLGGVKIGNRVEIGAGTTIDRGALNDTIIGDGVILDNQIQVAHNVVIGDNTAIAGCTAIAGSTHIGKNCTIAGACGITGHLEIADNTHVTAMSLVSKSLSKAGAYSSGTVVEPHQQWKRNVVRFRQLDDLSRRVKELEVQVKQSSEGQSE